MNFIKYLKTKVKFVVGIAALSAIVSQLILPATGASAGEPRFNFLAGDLELLRGANVTKNQDVWKDPISGQAGDEFRGLIYYHNGMLNTVAKNTEIKVSIPASTTNKTAKISASISADNAATATDTIVDGQVVGLSGLTVNFDQDVNLEFVPGTVRWFPNSNVNGGPNEQPVALPGGQTGNEIIDAHGINIGDINGCWEFAGFVTFGFRAKQKIAPTLDLTKTVRNDTAGENSFKKETSAEFKDMVEFNIDVLNSGEQDLTNAILSDKLPEDLTFVPNSLIEFPNGSSSPVTLTDAQAAQMFGSGLNIGTLKAGSATKNSFRFKAKVTETEKEKLINKATVTAAGLTASDTATVIIKVANIVKSKSAFNETRKEVAKVAGPSDVVAYTLTTKNTGTAAVKGFIVSDDITNILTFSDIVSISDAGKVELQDGKKVILWPATTVNPGQSITNTFKVKVKNPLPVNPGCEFKMVNVYGNEVVVIIEVPKEQANLKIEKFVRDVTTNETNFVKANQAFAGDTLEYRVNYSNVGKGFADNVKFTDTLPANTAFISGTTRISRNGASEQTLPDGIVGNGVKVETIAPGESGYITFRVSTSANIAAGQVLVNTAFLTFEKNTISSTAQTTIVTKGTTPVTPVATTSLPKTGSTTGASFMITFFMGIMFLYAKYRKELGSEESMIVNSLLS